jgi:hypothetical protein
MAKTFEWLVKKQQKNIEGQITKRQKLWNGKQQKYIYCIAYSISLNFKISNSAVAYTFPKYLSTLIHIQLYSHFE